LDGGREVKRLMDAYGDDVMRTAYMYLKDVHRCEDAFQEVFIRVYKKLRGFRGESSEKTWIIRITINVCKDMLRSSWLKHVLLTDTPKSGEGDAEEKALSNDGKRRLFEQVTSLPEPFRDVVILYYYHGLPTAEISGALGVAEGTVRSRLSRARDMLKERLQGRIDFDE
jgi:RNA polymerase sigma-70 factor (ECF subfamily)